MTDLERVLRTIDEDECGNRPHIVAPWVTKAADRIAALEALLREIDNKIVFETSVVDGTGNDLQQRVEAALGIRS
jgi:hypothetical protein